MIKSSKDMLAEKSHTDCLIDLMQFLVIAEQENDMYGMVTATQALESLQVILGYDDEKFEQLKNIFRV